MKLFRILLPLFLILLMAVQPVLGQTQIFEIEYGETVNNVFQENSPADTLLMLNARERDIFKIQVFRIGGQFSPSLRLLDGNGDVLAESEPSAFSDMAELIYDTEEGLPPSVVYQIEVMRPDTSSNSTENPPEYSVTLEYLGRRTLPEEDSLPLVDSPPQLEVGNSQEIADITVFGDDISTSASTIISSPTLEFSINATVEPGTITSATFLDNGIGLNIEHEGNGGIFFSDQSFSLNINGENDVRFILNGDNGNSKTIITDFRLVEWVRVQSGIVTFQMLLNDGSQKRLIFNNDYVYVRQFNTGGENEAPQYSIQLEDGIGRFIRTDLFNWETLSYLSNQLRIDYGLGARFLSDSPYYVILQNRSNPALNDISFRSPAISQIDLQIDWQGLAYVEVSEALGQVNIRRLKDDKTGIVISEALASLFRTLDPSASTRAVLIRDGAIRFTTGTGDELNYQTFLPDGTKYQSPSSAQLALEDFHLLPYEENFRTRNYNNLGENILPLCGCIEALEPMTPVNPANGNFFYKVTDFIYPSAELELEFTRYYNSHDNGLTPRYILNSPNFYPQMGFGWRHSYQYELDISTVPLRRIQFIEPDGTAHYFEPVGTSNTWSSPTLLSMRIIQEEGVLGAWRGETTQGLVYYFDRAGRLTRISNASQQSIIIVPSLANPNSPNNSLFIVDPYGRRVQLVTNDLELVTMADDGYGDIIYTHEGSLLTNVIYEDVNRTATYSYTSDGLLQGFDDSRSPYTQVANIEYDEDNRTASYTENPNGILSPTYNYSYSVTDGDNHISSQEIVVSGNTRRTEWRFNDFFQLTSIVLPNEAWSYGFEYDANGRLASIRIPTGVSFSFKFDEWGNLREFTNPSETVSYSFDYDQIGNRSFLTQIDYPSNRVDFFDWNDAPNPKLIEHRITISPTRTRTTRFIYDENERLAFIVKVDNNWQETNPDDTNATIISTKASGIWYQYNEYGYVSEIRQGIDLSDIEIQDIDPQAVTQAPLETALANASWTTIFEYYFDGNLSAIHDGDLNRTYILTWNTNQELNTVDFAFPGGRTPLLDYDYDNRGRVRTVVDRGISTSYEYNGIDAITRITTVDGKGVEDIQTFSYDVVGNLLTMRDDAGRTTSYRYDALDNLSQRTLANGAVYQYSNEIIERRLIRSETDPIGRVIVREYDSTGRLDTYIIAANIQAFQADEFVQEFNIRYNSANNPIRIAERISSYVIAAEYNFVGDLLSVGVEGSQTSFTYNDHGNLNQRTSPAGNTTRYVYNLLGDLTSVILPEGGQWQYGYDFYNNLEEITAPNALLTSYSYNPLNGQVASITDPQSYTQNFSYDEQGNLISITDKNNNIRTFEYDDLGRLKDVSQPNNFKLTYDALDNIISVGGQGSTLTLYSYDLLGRITSITDPKFRTTSYEYNPVGRISRIIDPIGNEQRFTWQPGKMTLTGYTNALGQSFSFTTNTENDPLGRISKISGGDSNIPDTYIEYDADGYITSVMVANESILTDGIAENDPKSLFEYDKNGNLIKYTDVLGNEWVLEYDAAGRIQALINPDNTMTRYEYENGSPYITRIAYYEDVNTPEPLYTESFIYDRVGNLTGYISPNGRINEYRYDQSNRLILATIALGDPDAERSYGFEYNRSTVTITVTVTDPAKRTTTYIFQGDNLRKVTGSEPSEENGENEQVFYNYTFSDDSVGNVTDFDLSFDGIDENLLQITQSYDALNRRVRYVNNDNDSWSYSYDEIGNLIQVSDPLGSFVNYEYDAYNRVTSIHYPSDSIIRLRYDGYGYLASVSLPPTTGAAQQIPYQFDRLGRVTQIGGTNNNRLQFTYDPMGNVIERIAADNVSTRYEYVMGRLDKILYADDTVDFDYDFEGNLTVANYINDDSLGSRYEYDILGQILYANENGYEFNYEYDLSGNQTRLTSEALGIDREYIYDGSNRVQKLIVGDIEIDFSYSEFGKLTDIDRRNAQNSENVININTTLGYNEAGRIEFININDRADSFSYEYDEVGNLIRIQRADASSMVYSFDVDHRLIGERWLDANNETVYIVSFRYDDAGNRIEEIRNGHRTSYEYNTINQLIREVRNNAIQTTSAFLFPGIGLGAASLYMMRRRRRWLLVPVLFVFATIAFAQTNTISMTVTYSYDPNGSVEVIRYGDNDPLILGYDAENRLTSVIGQNELGEDVDTELKYDQFSRLVYWRSHETEYTLIYEGDTLVAMSDGTSLEEYIYVDGRLLFTQTDGEITWHFNDQIGSLRRYGNPQGGFEEMEQFDFGSFGVRIYPYDTEVDANDRVQLTKPTILFAGQLYDPSTGFYLMGLRAYDPVIGRFLQTDPIRQDPFGTLYTYARNRPFVFSDPTGLSVKPFVEPLAAATLREEIKPESNIPLPSFPEIPEPASVAHLQEDETFRAFQLLKQLRYGTNTVIGQLSPLRDDFYLFDFNPIPAVMHDLSTEPLNQVMSLYESGEGWIPDLHPNPVIPINPYEPISEIEPLLAQAYVQPLQWTFGEIPIDTIIPVIDVPQGLSTRGQLEIELTTMLQPISLMTALPSEIERMLDIDSLIDVPQLPLLDVDLPTAPVEPATLYDLDTLRQQTYDFYTRILPPQRECDECVRPLSYNR